MTSFFPYPWLGCLAARKCASSRPPPFYARPPPLSSLKLKGPSRALRVIRTTPPLKKVEAFPPPPPSPVSSFFVLFHGCACCFRQGPAPSLPPLPAKEGIRESACQSRWRSLFWSPFPFPFLSFRDRTLSRTTGHTRFLLACGTACLVCPFFFPLFVAD